VAVQKYREGARIFAETHRAWAVVFEVGKGKRMHGRFRRTQSSAEMLVPMMRFTVA
jgi:hypothetical protein